MARTLTVCALVILSAGLFSPAAPAPDPTETVIRLDVSPMPAPRPALKYQLLPELKEMQHGNPLLGYMKCFMEQNHFFHNKEMVEKREKYQTMPLADLPVKELRGYGGWALRQADHAARLDTLDWQLLTILRRDGIYTLLPELQQLRYIAVALKVRFRVEVAERRFDDAIRTAKTMFALSRHAGENPTLIGGLVGMSICMIGVGPLEEMIGQPGCPNLYWALTNLPQPFVNLRPGLQGERCILGPEIAALDDPEPMGAMQLKKILAGLTAMMKALEDGPTQAADRPKDAADKWFTARAADEDHIKGARKRLLDHGLDAKHVKAYLPLQVALVDEKLMYEIERDEIAKAMSLPYWEYEAVLAEYKPRKKSEGLFLSLVPVTTKVKQSHTRVQQRLAMLRIVEALRLHAAAKGELPAKLADVKAPLPVDPFTGKSFQYKLEGGKASLQGTPPSGQEKNASFNVRYEIALRK